MARWIDLNKVLEVIKKKNKRLWSWAMNTNCKYINLRIDMRDCHCIIEDRYGKEISIEELEFQYSEKQKEPFVPLKDGLRKWKVEYNKWKENHDFEQYKSRDEINDVIVKKLESILNDFEDTQEKIKMFLGN